MKDKATSSFISSIINQKLGDAGKVESLHFDSALKKIRIELQLKGEPEMVYFQVNKYSIFQGDDGAKLNIENFTSNKAWVEILFNTQLKQRIFNIPSIAANMLS